MPQILWVTFWVLWHVWSPIGRYRRTMKICQEFTGKHDKASQCEYASISEKWFTTLNHLDVSLRYKPRDLVSHLRNWTDAIAVLQPNHLYWMWQDVASRLKTTCQGNFEIIPPTSKKNRQIIEIKTECPMKFFLPIFAAKKRHQTPWHTLTA